MVPVILSSLCGNETINSDLDGQFLTTSIKSPAVISCCHCWKLMSYHMMIPKGLTSLKTSFFIPFFQKKNRVGCQESGPTNLKQSIGKRKSFFCSVLSCSAPSDAFPCTLMLHAGQSKFTSTRGSRDHFGFYFLWLQNHVLIQPFQWHFHHTKQRM